MNGTGYVDIFATKGIEYLLVIAFLMALVVFARALLRAPTPLRAAAAAAGAAGRGAWFDLAAERYYHQGHTWAAPEGDDVVRVGLDDFAQKLVGVPERIHLPSVGQLVEQGERGLALSVAATPIDVLSPVSGQVLAINEEVLRSPGLLNADPYGEGWLLKVRVPRLGANLRNLLAGRLAQVWMEGTVAALRARMAGGELGTVLQDGGIPVSGIARELSPDQWETVAREFLHSV